MRLLLLLTIFACSPALGQGSVVAPGPGQTLLVNGEPFYPLGWNMVGSCTSSDAPPGADHRDEITATLEQMRGFGVNALFEAPFTSGRLIPHRSAPRWHNWYNYVFEVDGEPRETGHARPGVYVEALDWLMDRAVSDPQPERRIYTLVAVSSFITPGLPASPHGGSDHLDCPAYQTFIEEERDQVASSDPARAARIPRVDCTGQPARPFWEWNLWYVVHNLRDHPGLLGWYLQDEPEGTRLQRDFGIVQPDEPVRPFTGSESLPTPDLLRYAYRLVQQYETEGREADYPRHPVLVDVYLPDIFFSNRFTWSRDGRFDPNWHTGPFDRRPDGAYETPADIMGLDASNQMANPGSGEAEEASLPLLGWWSDSNRISARAKALREAAERDELWSVISVQAQAQLSGVGPFAIDEPLRCGKNWGQLRSRLLNDRDLVWHLMTLQADGLRGQLYYAHNLLPTSGPGAEMEARINRLIQQFRQARFDRVFAAPGVMEGWRLGPITVHTLTNYYRSAPNFVGPADGYDPGRSALAGPPVRLEDPDDYRVERYGRSNLERAYGQPVSPPAGDPEYSNHRHLRAAVHRLDGLDYLVLSNSYDARITADVLVDRPSRLGFGPEEGRYDLGPDGRFSWLPDPDRVRLQRGLNQARLSVDMEPYEVRVFRWESEEP